MQRVSVVFYRQAKYEFKSFSFHHKTVRDVKVTSCFVVLYNDEFLPFSGVDVLRRHPFLNLNCLLSIADFEPSESESEEESPAPVVPKV